MIDSDAVVAFSAELAAVDVDLPESELVDRIALLERIKSAAAAGQARAAAALDASRRAAEAGVGLSAARRGRGVASEVGLARRESPVRGSRYLGLAKTLVYQMPHMLTALECGALSERRAMIVVRESAGLDADDRATLDAELCADLRGLDGVGDTRLEAATKAIAYRLDPDAVVGRVAKAMSERRVTIRPARDSMTYLTALLPAAQGVSVHAALRRMADGAADDRSRDQVMADTLVERVTGDGATKPTPVAVNLVLSDEVLLGDAAGWAFICDYGPIPAAFARGLVTDAVTESRASLRRLYASPTSGALVALESRSRLFPRGLADFIGLRDQRCRTPYCDAPIRHRDHATPHCRAGPTSAANGLGACQQCNYAKEAAGWRVTAGDGRRSGRHRAEFITPTGARYSSTAPAMPTRRPRFEVSKMEAAVHITLADLHAA
jgi:hypothetical protein